MSKVLKLVWGWSIQIGVVNSHHDVDNMGMEHAEMSFGDSKGPLFTLFQGGF